MKFLCVACDEPMLLKETQGPDRGSMSIIYSCPACNRDIAMLTNAMETQMVRSLGVKIGGRTVAAEPMEMLRSSLAEQRDDGIATTPAAPHPTAAPSSGSKCPFTGVVTDAFAQHEKAPPAWTPEAEARLERIPSFVRPMVQKGVEEYAREKGYVEIDATVMEEVKGRFGM
jgi:hypothetical protein